MKRSRSLSPRSTFALLIFAFCTNATGGVGERHYKYALEKGRQHSVCLHMQRVYETSFEVPWRRPPLSVSENSAYAAEGRFAFERMDGVVHDDRFTHEMSFSRQPASREFDGISWKEGRYRFLSRSGLDHGDRPFVVAKVDLDNDGRIDAVFKIAFMSSFWPSSGSVAGGEDVLAVFPGGVAVPTKMTSSFFYAPSAENKPIIVQGVFRSRLLRLFRYLA